MKNKLWTSIWLVIGCLSLVACDAQVNENSAETAHNPANSVALVTGITGNQGGGVAATLLEKGYQIRGLTRDPSSAESQYWRNLGVEMVQGDFADYDSIDAALVDADYLFINLSEQVPDYIEASKHILDSAQKAGVKHLVYSSNTRSNPDLAAPASKTEIEIYLRESGYSYTTLRLPQMMSNFVRDRDMQNILRNGVVGRGSESATLAYFAPDDLGLLAAASFADTATWDGREVSLAGDELTDKELVALLSELSGLDIKYTPPPAEPDARWLANQGLSFDTELLNREFPEIMTLREYLQQNDYGEKLRAMSLLPLPPETEDRRRGGG